MAVIGSIVTRRVEAAEARKWVVLVATIWIQAFTGTNFDFSAYSSQLKSVLGISQVQLNYLAVASDLGKALGWSSGLALLFLPLPLVLFAAAGMGLAGYGLQWLVITGRISLSYISVFSLCLLAGCSICWFNTVCFILCIRNFSVNRSLALSLTISFNGLSAALYTLVVTAVSSSESLYLLLNAVLPLAASAAALAPILCQPPSSSSSSSSSSPPPPPPPPPSHSPPPERTRQDSHVFLLLNALAFLTGLYLLLLTSFSSGTGTARCLLAGALALLALPSSPPGPFSRLDGGGSGFNLVDIDDLEQLHKPLLGATPGNGHAGPPPAKSGDSGACCSLGTESLVALGEEHGAWRLVRRVDFWLYYISYFCGATVGLVYSNNIGQIAQSLSMGSDTTSWWASTPPALSSVYFARTGWLALAAAPAPATFFLLAWGTGDGVLLAGTAVVGLSSGFFFAAAVSVTSELFGPASIGVNHNILITNIPLGSLLYGLLAALVYDANGLVTGAGEVAVAGLGGDGAIVCMGRRCYAATFIWWGCISAVGLASSVALFLRTKPAYDRFERNRAALFP
ncbi:unnamed protein product [Spirodela intermedia]|uniref:Uncharacterized protein n=1 Tax=Spirodela intermedia TaxID=51605 RepID=A0A7I8JPJ4_SPIIN|nr:unnamed protein product [Spirodela intermedia]CAA6672076.1 unnamed protein product [Spirodela intermedia]